MSLFTDKFSPFRDQRGMTVIEALVCSLLLVVIFSGLSFVLSRGLVAQRQMNLQALAVMDIRNALAVNGAAAVCSGYSLDGPLSGITVVQDAGSPCSRPTVDLKLVHTADPSLSLEAVVELPVLKLVTLSNDASRSLLGGDGVVSFSSEHQGGDP